jgi:hypothetical protein
VLAVSPKTLSVSGGCDKVPKAVFPVEASALGELKKLRPGAWVFLEVREGAGTPAVVSIEIKKMPVDTGRRGDAGPGPDAKSAILFVRTDLPCSVSIDNKPRATLSANGSAEIGVEPGQHVLSAVGEGGLKRELIVEPKGPRTVVDIKLADLVTTADAEVDRVAAEVWVALADLKTAGAYAGSMAFGKSFGFHDSSLLATVHSAHESVRSHVESLAEKKPGNALRQKVVGDAKRAGEESRKYADLLTKAITMAQEKNTVMGEPTNLYGQAKALESGLTLSAEALEGLRGSQAFRDALPPDLRARAGLPGDPTDVRLGADYCRSAALMLAVVESGGLADKLGFATGDQLVSAAGKSLKSVWEFKQVLRENAGRKIPVTFVRKGKSKSQEIGVPAPLPQ